MTIDRDSPAVLASLDVLAAFDIIIVQSRLFHKLSHDFFYLSMLTFDSFFSPSIRTDFYPRLFNRGFRAPFTCEPCTIYMCYAWPKL